MNSNTNYSHILKIKILPRNDDVRQAIHNAINNIPILKTVKGMGVVITWRQYNNCYRCDVGGMLGDIAVNEHTKQLRKDLLNDMDIMFDNIFSNGSIKVVFDLSKPLTRKRVLLPSGPVREQTKLADATGHLREEAELLDANDLTWRTNGTTITTEPNDKYINIADRALVHLMRPEIQHKIARLPQYRTMVQLSNLKRVQSQLKTMKWEETKHHIEICNLLCLALAHIQIFNNEIFTSDILTDIQYMDKCLCEWLR